MELYWSPKLPMGNMKNVKTVALKISYNDLVNALRIWQPMYSFVSKESVVEITPSMASQELDHLNKLRPKLNHVSWYYVSPFVAMYTKAYQNFWTITNLIHRKYYCAFCSIGRCDSYCRRCDKGCCRECKPLKDPLCDVCSVVKLESDLKCHEHLNHDMPSLEPADPTDPSDSCDSSESTEIHESNNENDNGNDDKNDNGNDNENDGDNEEEPSFMTDSCRMCGHTYHRSQFTLCAADDCDSVLCDSCYDNDQRCLACVSIVGSKPTKPTKPTENTKDDWQYRLDHLPRGLTAALVEKRLAKYTRFASEYQEHKETFRNAERLGLTRRLGGRLRRIKQKKLERPKEKKKKKKRMMGKLPDGPYDIKRRNGDPRRKSRARSSEQALMDLVVEDQKKKRADRVQQRRHEST